jgi:hypothetical protein
MGGNEHIGWDWWKARPLFVVAVVSFCLTFYGLGFSNTFNASDLAMWPFVFGGVAGLVAGGAGGARDPSLLERMPFFGNCGHVWTFALCTAATGAFAAVAFVLTTNRFVPLHEYEQRILTVSAIHKGSKSTTTVFRDDRRCCLILKDTYGPVGARLEFRMRRGLWGYYYYTDYSYVIGK